MSLILVSLLIVQLLCLLLLFLLAGARYREFIDQNRANFQLLFMAPLALYVVDKTKLLERMSGIVTSIHHKIVGIYGQKNGLAYTKMFISQIISSIFLTLLFGTIFSSINNQTEILVISLLLVIVTPLFLIKNLDKQLKKRQDSIILELPEFLNKVVLLVNAGENVQKAIIRCVKQYKDAEKSPLYKELLQAVNELENNYSFQKVLEDFSKRCAVQEVTIFTTTILINYRRGGAEFVTALQALSRQLWEKRKALSRTLGEQASSKLVFPMVLIFLVVLLIIATPALMFM